MINLTIYGDSISTNTHGDGGYIKRLLKSNMYESIESYAISGSGLSTKTPNNLYSIVTENKKIPSNSNWILIWHGTNDWFYGSDLVLFETELIEIINKFKSSLPQINLVYLLPIYRYEAPFGIIKPGNAFNTKNLVGFTLHDYRDSLIKIIKKQNVFLIDMTSLTSEFQNNVSMYYEDQVHPNALGMDVIAEIINAFFTKMQKYI